MISDTIGAQGLIVIPVLLGHFSQILVVLSDYFDQSISTN